jgi:hypothetical protein
MTSRPRARAACSAQRSGPLAPPVITTVPGASSAMRASIVSRSVRASASYDRNSHVTVPVINTKAQAEAPSRRKVVRDSSTCRPEVARSSTRIINGCGSAIR